MERMLPKSEAISFEEPKKEPEKPVGAVHFDEVAASPEIEFKTAPISVSEEKAARLRVEQIASREGVTVSEDLLRDLIPPRTEAAIQNEEDLKAFEKKMELEQAFEDEREGFDKAA